MSDIKLRLARLKFTIMENRKRKLPYQIVDNEQQKVVGKFVTEADAIDFRNQLILAFCSGEQDGESTSDGVPIPEDDGNLSALSGQSGKSAGQVPLPAL